MTRPPATTIVRHLGVAPQLAPVPLEQSEEVLGHGADAAVVPWTWSLSR